MKCCEFLFGMPTPTLLECLDKYIPDHIFKNVVLDPPDPKYDNCCIIFDGVGCYMCFKFSKDDERHESLGECVCNYNESIDLYNMLRMKMWFGYSHITYGFGEPYTEEEQKLAIYNCIYNNYVDTCSKCKITKYCDSFRCRECSSDYCLTCFTEDSNAETRFVSKTTIHLYCHGIEYPYEGTYKCWKHYTNI